MLVLGAGVGVGTGRFPFPNDCTVVCTIIELKCTSQDVQKDDTVSEAK